MREPQLPYRAAEPARRVRTKPGRLAAKEGWKYRQGGIHEFASRAIWRGERWSRSFSRREPTAGDGTGVARQRRTLPENGGKERRADFRSRYEGIAAGGKRSNIECARIYRGGIAREESERTGGGGFWLEAGLVFDGYRRMELAQRTDAHADVGRRGSRMVVLEPGGQGFRRRPLRAGARSRRHGADHDGRGAEGK